MPYYRYPDRPPPSEERHDPVTQQFVINVLLALLLVGLVGSLVVLIFI